MLTVRWAPTGCPAASGNLAAEPLQRRRLSTQGFWPLPPAAPIQLVEDMRLPCLRGCQHVVNLTNGIEAVPQLQQPGLPFRSDLQQVSTFPCVLPG